MGRTELAIERAERALRLSLFDFYNFRAHHALALTYFYTGRYVDAVNAGRSAVHTNPRFSVAHAVLAAALLRSGRVAEAKASARNVLEHTDHDAFTIHGTGVVAGHLEPAVLKSFADAWREISLRGITNDKRHHCPGCGMSSVGTLRPSLYCRDGCRYRGHSRQRLARRLRDFAAFDPTATLPQRIKLRLINASPPEFDYRLPM